jgi:hypothetical protein
LQFIHNSHNIMPMPGHSNGVCSLK